MTCKHKDKCPFYEDEWEEWIIEYYKHPCDRCPYYPISWKLTWTEPSITGETNIATSEQ